MTLNGTALRFVVDSAANTSVLAKDLLERLGLEISAMAEIHALIALERAPIVRVERLIAGSVSRQGVNMVVADRDGLGGVDGLLGTDVLAGARLVMEFRRRRLIIARSRNSGGYLFAEGRSRLRYRAPAEQRFNNLMVVQGQADATPFFGILDTGARVSIVNRTMAEATGARPLVLDTGRRSQVVTSPTGLGQEALAVMVPRIGFGGVSLRQVAVLAGDFHTFDHWGFADRPAMLMGVDILGRFPAVSIDLRRSELVLET